MNLKQHIIGEDGEIAMVRIPQTKIMDGKKMVSTIEVEADVYRVLREVLVATPNNNADEAELKYDLFLKIKDADEVEFTAKEKKIILEILPSKFDTIFAGQVIKMLK